MEKNEHLIVLLKNKLTQIDELKPNLEEQLINQWKNEVLMILDQLIGDDSKYYKKFERISFSPMVISYDSDYDADRRERAATDLITADSVIKAILYGVENKLI